MRFSAGTAEKEVVRVHALRDLLRSLEALERLDLIVREPIRLTAKPSHTRSTPAGGVVQAQAMNSAVPTTSYYYTFEDAT